MTEAAACTIDRGHYPVIRVRWHRAVREGEALHYLRGLDSLLAEERKVTLIISMPASRRASTEQQLMFGNWLCSRENEIRNFFIGLCLVAESALLIMALRAIFTFVPPKFP